MPSAKRNPRVLIVTPEVTYLPDRMGNLARYLTAKAGGLADVSAALISALFDQGADVHVALPDYRSIFRDRLAPFLRREQWAIRKRDARRPDPPGRGPGLFLSQPGLFRLRRGKHQTRPGLPAGGDQQHHSPGPAGPDPLQRLDDRADPGHGPADGNSLPVHDPQHPHGQGHPGLHRGSRHRCGLFLAASLLRENGRQTTKNRRETNPVDFLASGVFAAHFVNTVSPPSWRRSSRAGTTSWNRHCARS